jgi:NAD(P)-dependent dehydrogenase (short-subunit alcohol dehydrogenase family)
MHLLLQDKHAMVTGGASAKQSRADGLKGADVATAARRKLGLEATARELAFETSRRIVPLASDVTSKEQVDRMVAECPATGRLAHPGQQRLSPRGSPTATGPIPGVIGGSNTVAGSKQGQCSGL